jgi:nucleoside-diphosphate-sugar epimerase
MSENQKRRVLVTGMNGLIGSAFYQAERDHYAWRALNRRPMPDVETVQADIADLDAIRPAFDGVDTVVHLAANARLNAPWEEILHANVIGTYNVFEAARQAGVRRVVFASSGATVSAIQKEEPFRALAEGRYADAAAGWPLLTHESMPRPAALYGVSKVWGEVLARHFVDTSPLSILCLRIGYVSRADRPIEPAHFANWCSQRDIVQAIGRAVEAPDELRYDIFFVTSNNKWSYRDLQHTRDVLGFVPHDNAEDYRA